MTSRAHRPSDVVESIQLIQRKPRLDLRGPLLIAVLLAAAVAVGTVAGGIVGVEQQVLGMVILIVMLITGVVCFYDLTFAVILWFYALTFLLRYTRLDLPGVPDMSAPRFMLVVMWSVFFVEVVLRRRQPLGLGRVEWAMAAFIVVHLVSMIHHGNLTHGAQRISPITGFMNFVVFPFTIYYLVRNACADDRSVRRMLIAFAVLQIHLGVTGILEHFRVAGLVFPPDILDPAAGEGRWYGARVRGPFLHTPVYGAVLAMGFYLALHLFNYTRGRPRWLWLVALASTPISVLYTLTRQAWLGFVAPLFLGVAFSRNQRILLALFLLAGATFAVMANWEALVDKDALATRAQNESTGLARIGVAAAGIQMFLDHPIFGIGLERWEETMEEYRGKLTSFDWLAWHVDVRYAHASAHNTFIRIAAELGLLGLIPLLAILGFIFQRSWHLFRRLPRHGLLGRDLVIAFWQLSTVYIICINFVDPSFGEFLPGYFCAWAAIIVRRAELAEIEARRGAPVPGYTLALEKGR